MPKLKIEKLGPGDLSWVGAGSLDISRRTEWMQTSDFTSKAADGVIPAGTALAIKAGQLKPYNPSGDTDTQKLVGFLGADIPVGAGKIGVSVVDSGRVVIANLPDKSFAVPAPEKDLTSIVFIPKGA